MSVDSFLCKVQKFPNMVVALPEWNNFEVCVTNLNLPTQNKNVSPNLKGKEDLDEGKEDFDENKNLIELKGKDLDELLRKHKLKISGKVSEKRERLLDFYKTQSKLKNSTLK